MKTHEIPDLIYKSELTRKIVYEASKILVKRAKEGNKKLTEKDHQVMKLFNYISLLQKVFEDISTVFLFLNVNITKLKEIFPEIETEETYYRYHFENFFIRIITIQDIIGKFGNILYKTGLKEKKCDAYKFKSKLETNGNIKAKFISDILKQTEDIKNFRNTKLHEGDAEIENFKGLVFWNDLANIAGIEVDKILHDSSNEKLQIEIKKLTTELISLINLVNIFFENSENEF